MSKRSILILKALIHLCLLAPFVYLVEFFRNGCLALKADPVNYITHFTGDWALYILLASLAVTPLRRLSPKIAFLIRFRRLVGLYSFFYASLHLATYIFLFSGYDLSTALISLKAGHPAEFVTQWKLVWPGIWDDLLKRRFIQVGFFSWLILLALACTSPSFMLRAMGGKNWQRLHRLVYIATIAACIHFWWLVKTGVRTPWKVSAVLAILFAARLIYTAMKKKRQSASIEQSA
ncbi:MAG: putative rane protein [Acidobacteriaceae bacterium]|nr:putative rane protein [Acidobacteriaceae bacterium]